MRRWASVAVFWTLVILAGCGLATMVAPALAQSIVLTQLPTGLSRVTDGPYCVYTLIQNSAVAMAVVPGPCPDVLWRQR